MSKDRDLVGEMLPTLCEKFMGWCDSDMNGQVKPFEHARDARHLFDALEALKREQKIRDYERVLSRGQDLRDAMNRSVTQRKWKMAQNLAASLVVELTELPILELVVLVQEEHKALIAGMDEGVAGFEAFDRFAKVATQIVTIALDVEKTIAKALGRPESGPSSAGLVVSRRGEARQMGQRGERALSRAGDRAVARDAGRGRDPTGPAALHLARGLPGGDRAPGDERPHRRRAAQAGADRLARGDPAHRRPQAGRALHRERREGPRRHQAHRARRGRRYADRGAVQGDQLFV